VEGLEIYFLARDEDISIDVVEWEDSSGKNISLFQHRFFWNTFQQAHIECFFIELLNDHLVDFLLDIKIVFLFHIIIEEDDPFLQIFNFLVCRFYLYFLFQIFKDFEWLWCNVDLCPNCSDLVND
jgi:hypothetical protein